ncbi:hypothetical protein [Actinoplanes sp. ATCC 53533]|uniref:hypothetical protein n=1 Tax=Actinoplanes sp. ATCC 53533 TaxID=1288362 RepID=UPI000F7A4141|nr:hypothetical protein [Actinoplanes sp. ATCC 53533]
MDRAAKVAVARATLVPAGLLESWPIIITGLDLWFEGRVAHLPLVIQWTMLSAIVGSALGFREYRSQRKKQNEGSKEQDQRGLPEDG